MARKEKIKELYIKTYEGEGIENLSLEDMEESLVQYYSTAGFDVKSIDDLFKTHQMDDEFAQEMQKRLDEVAKDRKVIKTSVSEELPF